MNFRFVFTIIILFNLSFVFAQKELPNHSIFDKILKKYVNKSGKVDYKSLKLRESELDNYLINLENNVPQSNWEKSEIMAYWINAYNGYTIKMILNNYPVKSITKLYNGEPWKYSWIKLAGKTISLDNIEHDILRAKYKDPRIHFAVNCASKSCPQLPQEAFTSKNLDKLLTQNAKSFFNSTLNIITKDKMKLSKILDWYKQDFGNVHQFVSKYSEIKPNKSAKIEYLEYDWGLNEQ